MNMKLILSAYILRCFVGVTAMQAEQPATKPADLQHAIARYLEDAQSAAAHVRYEWLRPDAFGAVADVQRRAGNLAGAKAALAEALKVVDREQADIMRYYGFVNLAEVQLRLGDLPASKRMIDLAARAAKLLPDVHLRARVFPNLALLQSKCGDAAGAQATWELTRQAIAQDGPPLEFSELAHSLAAAGKIDEARAIAWKAKDDFDAGRIWSAIARGQVESGDISGAIKSLGSLPIGSNRLGSSSGVVIAETLAGAGDIKGAESAMRFVFDDMDWSDALLAIVRAKLKAGDIDGAKVSADGISEENDQAVAFALIAPAQMKAGQENAARKSLAEAVKVAALVEPWFYHGSALCAIARAQAAMGNAADANASIARALVEAGKGDSTDYPHDRLWLLQQSIVEAQLQIGDLAGAKTTAAASKFATDDEKPSQAYRMIAVEMSKSGHADNVRSWIKSLSSELDRTYALIGAAEGLLAN